MTRRRSLRHLAYVAAASGLVTLAVAVIGISPVWLAVGPLLFVLADTLAFSPTVRRRLRAVALSASRRRSAPADRAAAAAEGVFYLRGSPSRRFVPWALGLLALAASVAASIVYLPPSVWVSLLATLVVLFVISLRIERYEFRAPPFRVGSAPQVGLTPSLLLASPTRWLQLQLDAAGAGPLTVVVVTFDGPVPAGLLADALATVAHEGARFHHLTANEFLLVGSSAAIHSALSLFGLGRFRLTVAGEPLGSVAFDTGEALYPRDGTTAEQLIAKARQARRSPHD